MVHTVGRRSRTWGRVGAQGHPTVAHGGQRGSDGDNADDPNRVDGELKPFTPETVSLPPPPTGATNERRQVEVGEYPGRVADAIARWLKDEFMGGGRRKTPNDSGVVDGLSSSLKKPGVCRVYNIAPNVFRPL